MNYIEFIKETHKHQKSKVCTKCKVYKPLSEFTKRRSTKDGHAFQCKSCGKEYLDNICPFRKWFLYKRGNAKKNGHEYNIEPTDIPGVKIKETIIIDRIGSGRKHIGWEATEYPKVCPVLGIELDWKKSKKSGGAPNSPSLDRINSKLGYIKGNVIMMSMLANTMKQNATAEQLKQFSRYILFGKR